MKPGISAVIVTHNQADLLKSCLKSIVGWVDEIIVIDLESTEDIKSVASSVKAKYHLHKQVAIVEEIRQESLRYVGYEYVLFIDPDESIASTLAKDLTQKIKAGEYDYFKIPRRNYVFGKWMEHSRWWPDFQTRVFRQGKVTWGTTLHSEPMISGSGFTYPIEPDYAIGHDNYKNLDEFIAKNMRYAKADALNRLKSNQDLSIVVAIKLSVSELISRFFQGQGYKDGIHGLVLALLQSFYYFMVYAYYWEAKKYAPIEDEVTIKAFPRLWFSHGLSEVLFWDKSNSFAKSIKEKFVRRMIG